jgi:hypothetical protein
MAYGKIVLNIKFVFNFFYNFYFFLPLGATAQGELWPPEQSASILRCDG